MAKLYYYYGSMGSSKSMNLLMAAYNYEDQGKEVLVFTSGVDDRAGYNIVKSRAGASREALPVHKDTNIYETVLSYLEDGMDLYCVLMDEVQFYSERHILELTKVVDALNIPVLAYGLKTDFRGKLFEGSKALLEHADKIEEIKTICVFCNRKATHNLRTNDGNPVYTGSIIQIGDEEYYPVCRKHHKTPPLCEDQKIKRTESVRSMDTKEKKEVKIKTIGPIPDIILYESGWRLEKDEDK